MSGAWGGESGKGLRERGCHEREAGGDRAGSKGEREGSGRGTGRSGTENGKGRDEDQGRIW